MTVLTKFLEVAAVVWVVEFYAAWLLFRREARRSKDDKWFWDGDW